MRPRQLLIAITVSGTRSNSNERQARVSWHSGQRQTLTKANGHGGIHASMEPSLQLPPMHGVRQVDALILLALHFSVVGEYWLSRQRFLSRIIFMAVKPVKRSLVTLLVPKSRRACVLAVARTQLVPMGHGRQRWRGDHAGSGNGTR